MRRQSGSRHRSGRAQKAATPGASEVLERGYIADLLRQRDRTAEILEYHLRYFSELEHQRSRIRDRIAKALNESCLSEYEFNSWQRAVKYKYCLHPLSTVGSIANIGQRFNAGTDLKCTTPLHACYLARDKDTALAEVLGKRGVSGDELTPLEMALTNTKSITIVSVSGYLERVFDLRSKSGLVPFLDLVKDFKISGDLRATAKKLGLSPPGTIMTTEQLHEDLLRPEWRCSPMHCDVPSNSQIFGRLVHDAEIEGILYSSVLTGSDCLAVFPKNFAQTSSFIALDDQPPTGKVPIRICDTNWRDSELSFEDL